MKKAILLLFICSSVLARAQQSTLFVTGKFSNNNLDSVANYITSLIGKQYILTSLDKRVPENGNCRCALFIFTDYAAKVDVKIDINYLGNQQNREIGAVNISGPYAALSNIYKKTFAPNADMGAFAQKFSAPPLALINGKVKPYSAADLGMVKSQVNIKLDRNGGDNWILNVAVFPYY
jgi:hypothetical protein